MLGALPRLTTRANARKYGVRGKYWLVATGCEPVVRFGRAGSIPVVHPPFGDGCGDKVLLMELKDQIKVALALALVFFVTQVAGQFIVHLMFWIKEWVHGC